MHVPRKVQRVQSPPKLSRYPVALLPGQYSDYCHKLVMHMCILHMCIYMYMLMRDEKEGGKTQARSNKQTRQSNTAHSIARQS